MPVSCAANDVIRGYEGSVVAIAFGGGTLPDNKRYAISANRPGYHGTSAFGATALLRVSDNIVLNGEAAWLHQGDVGGRAGVTFTW